MASNGTALAIVDLLARAQIRLYVDLPRETRDAGAGLIV
jgi:hypothetical protein